jgi:asparagine synthase (glutamine-hydrolysing)
LSGICGFYDLDVKLDGAARLWQMLAGARMAATDRHEHTVAGASFAGFGADTPIRLAEHEGFLMAVVGHPVLISGSHRTSDIAAIAKALRQEGEASLRSLGGDFALATWDAATSRGLLAIDRIGVRRLAYARVGRALAFASTLDVLCGFPGVQRTLSPQAIYDFLYFHVCPAPQSIYEDVSFLLPGHYIEFSHGAAAAPRPYWSMRFAEDTRGQYSTLQQEFIKTMRSAVVDSADGATTGSFLSGGTDSSTVAGMLSRSRGGTASTFSIGFDVKGYDEMQYARIAARHFGLDSREYYVTPDDVVDTVSRIATHYDQPFANASAVPAYYCARLARDSGMSRLLAGDGGDELFGGNERYARQHIFSLYHRLPSALRRKLIEPVALSAPMQALPGLRKMSRYVEQARPDMPLRYETYNLLAYLGPDNVLEPDFLAVVDRRHPRQLLHEAHAPYTDASPINQLLGIDLRFTLNDNDLPKVTGMCELAGIDVAFPLLDDRILDFSARLPADYKLKGTQLRWFFKEALRDFLPPEIIAKQKHGFGLPVGEWIAGHAPLRKIAEDSLRSLHRHHFVRPDFVDELLERRLAEHPKYFGNMVWILMMLGLWLDSRGH